MAVGDSVIIPFRRYSHSSILAMASQMKAEEGLLFETTAKNSDSFAKVTRLR